jgi:hypothetical protein
MVCRREPFRADHPRPVVVVELVVELPGDELDQVVEVLVDELLELGGVEVDVDQVLDLVAEVLGRARRSK